MGTQQGQAFEDLRNTVSECTRIVRQRWRLAAIGLSIVASVAFWYSQYLPREYSAQTLFERRDDVVLQNLVRKNSPYGFEHLKTTMKMDMIGSRAMARALANVGLVPADQIKLDGALTETERGLVDAAVGRYRLQPEIGLLHSTSSLDTIRLTCHANDPIVARKVVVALRDGYIEHVRTRIREILEGTKAFFEEEVANIRRRVQQADERLLAQTAEFEGLDPTDLVSAGNRLEMLRSRRDTLFQEKAGLEADIAAREAFLENAPVPYALQEETPTSQPVAVKDQALGRPSAAEAKLDEAIEATQSAIINALTARRMTWDHPHVQMLVMRRESLEELKKSLAELGPDDIGLIADTAPPPPPEPKVTEEFRQWQAQQQRVRVELAGLRERLEVADRQLTEAEDRLMRFESLYTRMLDEDDEYRRMLQERNAAASEVSVWQSHLISLKRVLVAESGQRGTQFSLLEEPIDVMRPTRPRVASIFVVSSGLGLAAAALLVALAELFDRSFRSVGQVTRVLGVPVLESIGVIPTPRERRHRMMTRLIWAPVLSVLLMLLMATAGLAYTSLAMPRVYEKAMKHVDSVLGATGMMSLSPLAEPLAEGV